MRKFTAGILATIVLGFAGSASAQSNSSDSVDAIATLQSVTPPLTVSGQSSLTFGDVNLPNGTQPGHSCQYSIAAASGGPSYSLRELNESGSSVDTSVPTASSCDWGSGGTPGGALSEFIVACNPSTPVSYTAFVSSSGIEGVDVYWPHLGSILGIYNENNYLLQQSPAYSYTISDHVCPANGQVTVRIGASLIVGETASAATNLTVGTLTLEANY